jgi:predicted dinucleotide-binding enzyme
MNIAVIGSGNIGGTLARKWAVAGHQVVFGARDPAKADLQQLVVDIGANARAATIEHAVQGSDVVLFAVPGAAMGATVAALGTALAGKLVFDATNNIGAPVISSVATIAEAAPHASVYRAFNIYGYENFAQPVIGGVQADLFFAGPDGEARASAEQLIRDVGLHPVWIGGSDHAELLDQFTRIWFTLAFEQKMGRLLAFKLLTP